MQRLFPGVSQQGAVPAAGPQASGRRSLPMTVTPADTHTRLLMGLSAAFLAAAGLLGAFLPQEILWHFEVTRNAAALLLTRLVAAAYLAFALLNWTARGILIGGIYARPVALANFLHFVMLATTLLGVVERGSGLLTWLAFLPAAGFAFWFGYVLFRPPAGVAKRRRQ